MTMVSLKLQENETWFRERCRECADIKFSPMYLGMDGSVPCLAIYIETAVSNLMLEESMLGRMLIQLREMPPQEVRVCLRRNEMGISDASPLDTLEDAMRAMLAGNLILLVDGFEKILKTAEQTISAVNKAENHDE